MKKKQLKSNGNRRAARHGELRVSVNELQANGKEGSPVPVTVTVSEFPPSEYLLQKARKESNRKVIESYTEAIRVLRDEKGFSFREIGDWLTDNGVEADYNSVYRVYTKGMSEAEAREVELDDAKEERE